MSARFRPDHRGVGEMLRSGMIEGACVLYAEGIKAYAEAISPVGSERDKDSVPGRYKASFHVRHHSRGGATNDRAEAVVYNDSPEAFYVEFAKWGSEPYRILTRAANEVRLLWVLYPPSRTLSLSYCLSLSLSFPTSVSLPLCRPESLSR